MLLRLFNRTVLRKAHCLHFKTFFPAVASSLPFPVFQNTVRKASKFYSQPPEGLAAAAEAHQVFSVPKSWSTLQVSKVLRYFWMTLVAQQYITYRIVRFAVILALATLVACNLLPVLPTLFKSTRNKLFWSVFKTNFQVGAIFLYPWRTKWFRPTNQILLLKKSS